MGLLDAGPLVTTTYFVRVFEEFFTAMTDQPRFVASLLRIVPTAILSMSLSTLPAHARDGSEVYDETCLLCHGPITENTGWYPSSDGSKIMLAVVTPRGPTLNGIVGRPPAIISNYSYSKGMRKYALTGPVWDRETIDLFLTDSRKYVKGTFMIMKMDQEDRKLVLDYLEGIAVYRQ